MTPEFTIETTVANIPIWQTIDLANGHVWVRIPNEQFDEMMAEARAHGYAMNEDQEMAIEEGAVPFMNIRTGEPRLVDGSRSATLIPEVPQAFEEM